jgi:hypothetical protein
MKVCKVALTLCLMAVIGAAHANDNNIVRWVDDQGVTHFGDARIGPAEATEVQVAATNGMDKPSGVASSSKRNGPVWTVIDQAPKQNKNGWRSKGAGPRSGPIAPSQR